MGVDLLERALAQTLPLQEMTEVEDRGLIGQGLGQAESHEPPDRFGIVEQVLHAGGAEVVKEPDTVNPQHNRQRVWPASLARLGMVGTDALLQQPARDGPFIRSRNNSRRVLRLLP